MENAYVKMDIMMIIKIIYVRNALFLFGNLIIYDYFIKFDLLL